jgi:hypothetical protein
MYKPFVFKLKNGNSDILNNNPDNNDIILSTNINLPLFSLGFHQFINRTKESFLTIIKNLKSETDFYYVVNNFEDNILNYEDDINNISKIYFDNNTTNIISRSFYKLWEILFLFDIADKKELTYALISDNPSTLTQSIINYRQKLGPGILKDKIFNIMIQPNINKNNFVESGEQFIGYYNKLYPDMFQLSKTIKVKNFKSKETITNIKNISSFKKDIEKTKSYTDLIIADSELVWDNVLNQEQESYQLILGQIVAILKTQTKNGNAILKIFNTFTIPTIKMIYLLSSFYDETYIYKPLFSRPTDSEKYLICKKFNHDPDSKLLNNKIKSLEYVLEKMSSNKFIFDIYNNLDIPIDYINDFKLINTKLINQQQIICNKIITYIKENNYFGDMYHSYKNEQIDATKWWVNYFYPPSNNLYIKNKEDLHNYIKIEIEQNNKEAEKLNIIY